MGKKSILTIADIVLRIESEKESIQNSIAVNNNPLIRFDLQTRINTLNEVLGWIREEQR